MLLIVYDQSSLVFAVARRDKTVISVQLKDAPYLVVLNIPCTRRPKHKTSPCIKTPLRIREAVCPVEATCPPSFSCSLAPGNLIPRLAVAIMSSVSTVLPQGAGYGVGAKYVVFLSFDTMLMMSHVTSIVVGAFRTYRFRSFRVSSFCCRNRSILQRLHARPDRHPGAIHPIQAVTQRGVHQCLPAV